MISLQRGQVVVISPSIRGGRPVRVRVEGYDQRGFYVGMQLGLSKSERLAGGIPPLRVFRVARIMAVRVPEGLQLVLPGVYR
jgi:hypothetical protein